MNLYSDYEVLAANVKYLAHENKREKATIEIKHHVEAAARELSLERFGNFENELYQHIFSYLHSGKNMDEKIGGIMAIKELIECTSAAAENKVTKFASTLAMVLKSNTDFELIELVVDTFGHMIQKSPVSQIDFVDSELHRALEWLRGEQSHRRFAACAILTQLAENAPTVFFSRTKEFFDLIWGPLWDVKDRIRLKAAAALSACLAVLSQRTYHLEWYCRIYSNIHEGLKRGTAETVHGSLLVVKEVLVHTGEFMVPRFKEISKAILEFKDHKSTVVRAAIAQLLPSLAEFCPDAFAHAHMNETVDFLQKGSKIPELRTQSLVSSGQLCLALGHHLADRVNDLIVIVKDALLPSIVIIIMPSSKGPTLLLSSGMPVTADLVNKEAVSEALQCIGRMVQGLGTRINDRVELLLEIMFLTGITPHLIDTLSIVVRYVPSKLDIIQEKLLLETMKVLGGDLKFMSLVPDHLYSWGRVGSRRRRDVGSKLLRGHMVFNSPSPPLLRPSQSSTSLFIQEQSMRRGGLSARQQQLDMVGVSALYSGRSPPLHLDPVTSRNPTPPLPTTASLISMGVQKGLSLIGLGSHARTRSTSDFNGGAAGSFPRANLNRDPIAIVLSLKTLGSLTLSSCNIIPLLMNSVLPFFESIDHTVRREAAVTCAHMVSLAMIKTSLVTRENEPYIPYGSGGFSRRTRAATIASPIPSNETRPTSGSYSETTPIAKRTSSVSSADHSSSFDINPKEVFSPKPKRIDSLITNSLFDESHLLSSSTPGLPVTATGSKTPRAKNSRSEISRPNTTDIPQSLTVPAPSYSKRAANRKTNIYTHGPTAMYIDTILTRLLQIIVSDPNQDVRQSALRCVITSPIFDSYISRKNHIDTLIFLLADDMFDIRIDALTVLGRLALINPALVLPPLRMALVRLISEISHSADSRQKEDSILIVCQFLNCTSLHQLVKAYVGSLIKVLPLQADIRLTTASLSCIGEICKVMRQDMIPYFDDLLPILVKNMQDQSSRRKQEVAISTLGLLVSATGKVVEPYLKYPQLLPKALDLLFKSSVNTPMTLRMETLRCIGLIGALEPQKYNLILQHLQSLTEKKGEIIEGYSKRVAPTTVIDVAVPHSFVSTTGAGGGGKEESRLRSDSLAQQDWNASAGGRRVKSGSEVESELIRSEVVLEDANFDQPACLFMYSQCVMRSVPAPSSQETLRRTPHNEDYYPRVAIAALVRILHERALSVHHSAVTQAIVTIFKSLGMKSVPFLDELVPFLLHIMRVGGPGLRESLLQQFSTLVSIVQYHISVYLPAVFEIIHDFWFEHLEQVLILVEDIAVAASNQFGSYFTEVLPLLLSSIVAPKNMTTKSLKVALQLSGQSAAALFKPLEQVLSCCNALRGSLLPHLHLVIPILCKLMAQLQEIGTDTVNWQILTVRTIRKICTVPRGYASISDQSDIVASRLVHCLTNTISWCYSPASTTNSTTIFYSTPTLHEPQVPINSAIYVECIHTLCSVGIQIGPKFITFDNLILRTLSNKGLNITEYLELSRLMSSGMLPEFDYGDREVYRSDSYEEADGLSGKIGLNSSKVETDMVGIGSYYVGGASARMQDGFGRLTTSEKFYMNSNTSTSTSAGLNMSVFSAKLPFNQQQLSRAWDVSQRSTSTDWLEWFRRLKVELIRESPNPALRACSALCQAYPPLANELFHASFVSCWYELSEQYQDSLVRALQRAFKSSTIPPECLQTLLNLAEFMEHDVEPLPISLSILAELAQKGHAYAKALHYRELEFQSSPATCFESLVTINKKLDQYDAAVGILTVVEKLKKKHPELQKDYTVHESWLAKLGYWNEALTKYEERLQSNPTDGEAMAGKLKCLDALGRWEEAISLCNESLDHLKRDIALISQIPATRDGREGRDTRDSSPKDISTSANRVGRDQESLTMRNRKTVADQQKRLFSKAAVIGARAAWSLNEWNLMESFVTQLPEENLDASFMRAVLAIHRENFTDSSRFIEQTRLHLDSTITALLAESYGRAYVPLIMVQQCSELEEIAEYKMLLREAGVEELDSQPSNNSLGRSSSRLSLDPQHLQQPISTRPPLSPSRPLRPGQLPPVPLSPRTKSALKLSDFTAEDSSSAMSNEQSMQFSLQLEAKRRKELLVEKWRRRLRGCYSSGRAAIPVWKYLLNGRRMILNEREDLDTWLDFASLCLNGGNVALAERVLQMSQRLSSTYQFTPRPAAGPSNEEMDRRIKLAVLKHQWAVGSKSDALIGLESLIRDSWSLPSISSTSTIGSYWQPTRSLFSSIGSQVNTTDSGMNSRPNAFDPFGNINKLAPLSMSVGNFGSSLTSLNEPPAFNSGGIAPTPMAPSSITPGLSSGKDASIHLESLLLFGEWKVSILGPEEHVDQVTRREVLAMYRTATTVDLQSYQAWHQWGLSNIRAIEEARESQQTPGQNGSRTPTKPINLVRTNSNLGNKGGRFGSTGNHAYLGQEVLVPLAVNAIDGLMKALSLGTKRWSSTVTEDMLNIMLLWFRYGHINEVADALEQRLSMVHLDTWLGVLPQLIARIDHPGKRARELLHSLLARLGEKHAQALVYPLSVALKSPREERKLAAESLMNSLKQHSKALIEQALLVSQELIRVAILWQEVWHESLEEASRLYFGEGNIQGMLDTLFPLHHILQLGPMTHRETSFLNAYGAELNEAWQCISNYSIIMKEKGQVIPTFGATIRKASGQNTQEETLLHQAWDLYYNVFKKINNELTTITSLELQFVSPALTTCRNLDLGVPGTYVVSGDAVRIASVGTTVAIIRSKQRPRKIKIYGHDGQEFVFLLKGHEDLRQDERAMQLFGLVNALLQHDSRTGGESHDLSIQRYAVIPLSPTAGLISWVPNSDTFHDLIRDFRDSRKIMLNLEHKIMMQLAPNNSYDLLSHPHKLEVFEHALANTDGDDLAKILWLKSETSETWLTRRNNYTRSLAVMSMVGYVLGLGDRHPSNLMLDRKSGKVLHIDFGDCFEVAMQREKFPEKVPFRLTRMLVKAMEVSGIEGSYRLTCEKVMTVLRENRDSLIAVLEAFVHDPLLSWRLLNTLDKTGRGKRVGADNTETTSGRKSPFTTTAPNPSPIKEAADMDSSHVTSNNTKFNSTEEVSHTLVRTHMRSQSLLDRVDEGDESQTDTQLNLRMTMSGESTDSEENQQVSSYTPDHVRSSLTSQIIASEGIAGAAQSRMSTQSSAQGAVASIPIRPARVAGASEPTSPLRPPALKPASSLILMSPLLTKQNNVTELVNTSAIDATSSGDAEDKDIKTSSYHVNLHLEMSAMAGHSVTGSGSATGFSFRLRSVRSISMAEKLAGSINRQLHIASAGINSDIAHEAELAALTAGELFGVGGDSNSSDSVELDLLQEELKEKAVSVIRRVRDKLTGLDFNVPSSGHVNARQQPLEVEAQVDRLILQATSNELLCQGFFGWCPFW